MEGNDRGSKSKIGRPRQLYIGSPRRDYVAIDKRSK